MSKRSSLIHAILSVIGILLGLSACVVFYIFENVDATVWAFLSAVFAAANFQLHFLHLRDTLEDWHNVATLSGIKFLAFTSSLISFAVMSWYCFRWIYFNIPVLPVSSSVVIAMVWTFMTLKWGVMLHITASRYSKIISESERTPLLG